MKTTQFKLVCTDLDQTLIDSGTGFLAANKMIAIELQKILESNGIKLEYKIILDTVNIKGKELDHNRTYNRDIWWDPMLKEFNNKLVLNIKEIRRLTKAYWDTVIKDTKMFPDTFETLEYLKEKKYKLALITDTDGTKGIKDLRLKKSKVMKYFDYIIIAGEHTPEPKPDPEPFLLAARLANVVVSKENCVMVGDKDFTDIKGSKAAGFTTILILRSNWKIETIPDYYIKELFELRKIL